MDYERLGVGKKKEGAMGEPKEDAKFLAACLVLVFWFVFGCWVYGVVERIAGDVKRIADATEQRAPTGSIAK